MDKALGVFENYMTDSGLIGPTPYWPFVDWVPGWQVGVPDGGREEPLTVTCLMYAAALRAGAEICRTLGRAERAAEYERRAAAMIDRVNALCYDADAGLYRNAPRGARIRIRPGASATAGHRHQSMNSPAWFLVHSRPGTAGVMYRFSPARRKDCPSRKGPSPLRMGICSSVGSAGTAISH